MAYVQISRLIPAPRAQIFALLNDLTRLPEAFEDYLRVSFSEQPPQMAVGLSYELNISCLGIGRRLTMRVEKLIPGELVVVSQVHGPFQFWEHSQILAEHDTKITLLTDIVDYRMPMGLLGFLSDDLIVRRAVEKIIQRRQERLRSQSS